MKVKDIMSRGPLRVEKGYSLKEVSRIMLKGHVNGVPVVDPKGRVLGMVTQADVFRTLLPSYEDVYKGEKPHYDEVEEGAVEASKKKVEKVMHRPVVTVDEDTPVIRAGSLMLLKGIKQLPVVKDDALVGIVTFTDIIEALIISTPKN